MMTAVRALATCTLCLAVALAALGNAMLLAKIRETNSWIPAAGMVLVGFALGAIAVSSVAHVQRRILGRRRPIVARRTDRN